VGGVEPNRETKPEPFVRKATIQSRVNAEYVGSERGKSDVRQDANMPAEARSGDVIEETL
jgi:hypothetical protein